MHLTPRPPDGENLKSREALDTAIFDLVETKTKELRDMYGSVPELKEDFERTIKDINDLENDFLRGGTADEMMTHTTTTFDDVLDIFKSRLEVRALKVINAATNPRNGVIANTAHKTRNDLDDGMRAAS